MRWRSIVGEAWRNVVSGTAFAAQLAGFIGLVGAAAILIGSFDIMAIAARGEQYRDAGANVLIIQSPGSIDPRACETLNATPGVIAGALRRASNNIVAAALPGSRIPTYEITPGLAGLIMAEVAQRAEGVLLSGPAADTLEVAGDQLATTTGAVRVGGVYPYPDDGRRGDLEFAVLAPTAEVSQFDECWIETWPPSAEAEMLLRTTWIPSGPSLTSDAVLSQWNGTLGTTFGGQQLFESRPTRWLPALAGAAAFGIVLVTGRLRKVELASARHCGVTLADQWLIAMSEAGAWALAVVALAMPSTLVALAVALPGDEATYLQLGVAVLVLTIVGGLAGATVSVFLSGERHLFRHLKNRR
ncbi:MAG: hypothetical protein KF761_01965 [Salinibacterium sp.]|nr:hypothetical protein [Salinibacterium sp.]